MSPRAHTLPPRGLQPGRSSPLPACESSSLARTEERRSASERDGLGSDSQQGERWRLQTAIFTSCTWALWIWDKCISACNPMQSSSASGLTEVILFRIAQSVCCSKKKKKNQQESRCTLKIGQNRILHKLSWIRLVTSTNINAAILKSTTKSHFIARIITRIKILGNIKKQNKTRGEYHLFKALP